MQPQTDERKPKVHARKSTRSILLDPLLLLLGALWVIVVLLLLTGCDSVHTSDSDDSDCVAAFHPDGAKTFCDLYFPDTDVVASASFAYDVAVAQHARVRLDAVNGPVEIHGDPDATSVRVAGKRRVGSESLRDAERHLDDLEVRVDDLTDEVFIKTVQPPQPRGRQYVVEYTITVPEHLDVEVDHVNGDVEVRDVTGSVRVDLTNGVIDCFSTLPPPGTVDLALVNGDIRLGIPTSTSAAFSARVTNGRINTSNLVLEDLVRSPRSMTGRLGDGEGTIDLSVVNGTITVNGH